MLLYRGQGVLVDNELHVRMILTQLNQHSSDGVSFTVLLGSAVLLPDDLRAKRDHLPEIRMDNSCANGLQMVGYFAAAALLFQAGR